MTDLGKDKGIESPEISISEEETPILPSSEADVMSQNPQLSLIEALKVEMARDMQRFFKTAFSNEMTQLENRTMRNVRSILRESFFEGGFIEALIEKMREVDREQRDSLSEKDDRIEESITSSDEYQNGRSKKRVKRARKRKPKSSKIGYDSGSSQSSDLGYNRSSMSMRNSSSMCDVKERRSIIRRFLDIGCTFDGKQEPFEFITKFEYASSCDYLTDEEKKGIFPALLTDMAAHWFSQNVGFRSTLRWNKIKEKFCNHYQLYAQRAQASFDIENLERKPGQPIIEFISEFERLFTISKGPRSPVTEQFWIEELHRRLPGYLQTKIFLNQGVSYDKLKENICVVSGTLDIVQARKRDRKRKESDRPKSYRNVSPDRKNSSDDRSKQYQKNPNHNRGNGYAKSGKNHYGNNWEKYNDIDTNDYYSYKGRYHMKSNPNRSERDNNESDQNSKGNYRYKNSYEKKDSYPKERNAGNQRDNAHRSDKKEFIQSRTFNNRGDRATKGNRRSPSPPLN